MVQYEAFLTEFFTGLPAAGMCQYDRRRLPSTIVDMALATHSSVFQGGVHAINPFLQPRTTGFSGDPH